MSKSASCRNESKNRARYRTLRLEPLENRLVLSAIASLVEDSNPNFGINNTSGSGSDPSRVVSTGIYKYFSANDGVNGRELYRVTTGGLAELVEDGLPGGGINPGGGNSNPDNLTNVSGTLYFQADDSINGNELWRVGNTGAASLVEDSVAGGGLGLSSYNNGFITPTNLNGTLYFYGDISANASSLWHPFRINSSGNAEIIEDSIPGGGINPIPGNTNVYPPLFTDVNGTTYFRGNTVGHGRELWRASGQGTSFLVNGGLSSGNSSADPQYLTNVNGTLYFIANDNAVSGTELWKVNSSGVASVVEDSIPGGGIRPGSVGSFPQYLTSANNALYFSANDGTTGFEAWKLNSSGVAERIEDSIPGGGISPGSGDSRPRYFTNVQGTIYFVADDGVSGRELWRINNTGRAELVEDNVPGSGIRPGSDTNQAYILSLTVVGDTLYFSADDGTNGQELWRINSLGIAELVENSIPGGGINETSGSIPQQLTNVGGTLYFVATGSSGGRELWTVNAAGIAELVEDSIPGGGINPIASSDPFNLTNVDGTLYFSANDGTNGIELWHVSNSVTPTITITSGNKVYDNIPYVPVASISGNNSQLPFLNFLFFADAAGSIPISAPENVGTYYVRAFTLANASNVASQSPITQFQITPFGLTSNATAANKTYDATTAASVTMNLVGVFSGDVVTANVSGFFSNKSVGVGKTVTVGSIFLLGADANNYTVMGPSVLSADITPYALTASGTAPDKVYDANTAATVTVSLGGVFSGDTVSGSASGTFADRNVGVGKTVTIGSVTLAGADANNYSVGSAGTATANITAKSITGNITAANKAFDGNTSATILTRTLTGVESGDTVSYVGGTATFASSAVGTGIVVTATGLSLSGADAANYSVNTTAATTANITAAGSVVNRRVFYNGATLNGTTTVPGATGFGASGTVGSSFSATGGNPAPASIDTKVALLPGQNSSFANYTNASFGLNGIIVDIANAPGTLTAADFSFATGFGAGSSTAFTTLVGTALAAVDPQVTQYVGGGINGSTRAKIAFDNDSLRNTWLRVTVLATANTGLAASDVFYFGNVVGDVNASISSGRYAVNPIDTSGVRNNQSTTPNSVLVSNIYDFNKSGNVNPLDTSVVRSNQQTAGIVQTITNAPARGIADTQVPAVTTKGSPASSVGALQVIEPMTNSAVTKTAVSTPSLNKTDEAVKSFFAQSKSPVLPESSQSIGSIDDFFADMGNGMN